MNHHDHHDCDHEVKYCKKCDVAYCVKCGKEWIVQSIWYYPPYTYTWGTSDPLTVTTTSGSSSGHVH